jgi:hypothetical protein
LSGRQYVSGSTDFAFEMKKGRESLTRRWKVILYHMASFGVFQENISSDAS